MTVPARCIDCMRGRARCTVSYFKTKVVTNKKPKTKCRRAWDKIVTRMTPSCSTYISRARKVILGPETGNFFKKILLLRPVYLASQTFLTLDCRRVRTPPQARRIELSYRNIREYKGRSKGRARGPVPRTRPFDRPLYS